jgi:hypothetical protein
VLVVATFPSFITEPNMNRIVSSVAGFLKREDGPTEVVLHGEEVIEKRLAEILKVLGGRALLYVDKDGKACAVSSDGAAWLMEVGRQEGDVERVRCVRCKRQTT